MSAAGSSPEPEAASGSGLWRSEPWRAQVTGWIDAALVDLGRRRTGPVREQRVRVWSASLTAETDHGLVWFKQNCSAQSFEAALVEELAVLDPVHIDPPLAVESTHGWLLSRDQGPTLDAATVGGPDDVVERFCDLLAAHAVLQRGACAGAGALLATGLTDRRPAGAGQWLERAIDARRRLGGLNPDDPSGLDAAEAAALRATVPAVRAAAARLDDGPVPLSIQHNDLHDRNVFPPTASRPAMRFFDWGDAVWADPFSVLLIALRVLADRLDEGDGGSQDVDLDRRPMRRAVDAYLGAWTDLADPATLRDLVAPAMLLGRLHRAEAWSRVLAEATADEYSRWGSAPVASLLTLVSAARP